MDTSRIMKSQSATEFMMFMGMAIIILISYFAIAHHYLDITYKQRDIISGQDLVKQIRSEINLAARVEEGYRRTFQLPITISNKEFTVEVGGKEVVVTITGDDNEYVALLTTNIDEADSGEGGQLVTIEKEGDITISFE